MNNLFSEIVKEKKPLAIKYRPENIEEFIGQNEIIGKNSVLFKMVEKGRMLNSIFYGSPGTGKTTLATLITKKLDMYYEYLNAIKASKKDIKEISDKAKKRLEIENRQTLLFFDEIHRFNKLQQDSLLHDIEEGNIVLIGATTENPYYSLNNALLSRCLTFEFKKLKEEDILIILKNILEKENISVEEDILRYLSIIGNGDARQSINFLQLVLEIDEKLTLDQVKQLLKVNKKSYDKVEDKYNTISAFIKSVRGSDPDASIYWLSKMLSGGEDPLYIARRLVILASEDIGLANPQALTMAVSAMQATKEIGMPEIRIILSEVTIYLAGSIKSNSSYNAIDKGMEIIENGEVQEVPRHLTQVGKEDYKYPHSYEEHFVNQKYMDKHVKLYEPKDNKYEEAIKNRLNKLWNKKNEDK